MDSRRLVLNSLLISALICGGARGVLANDESLSYHSMALEGTIIPKTNIISVEMPLKVPVILNFNTPGEEAFQSPEITIINRSQGQEPVEITYLSGDINLGGQEAELVGPTEIANWSSLSKRDSHKYFALGVTSDGNGWMDDSPIKQGPVWFSEENKVVGYIPALDTPSDPKTAKFKYVAKHGEAFPEQNVFNVTVFLTATFRE